MQRNTSYKDYLRVYDDSLTTADTVWVFGTGSIYRTSYTTDPDDRLRYSHFAVKVPALGSELVISTTAGQTERLCSGDSGGPYLKRLNGLDLVAGVHHGTDRDSAEFCPEPGGSQWGEKLTWSGSDDLDWLESHNSLNCTRYTPSGSGNNYARCFSLPFVNDAPDREQENGGKLKAVAQLVAAIL